MRFIDFNIYSEDWIGKINSKIIKLLKRDDRILVFLLDGLSYYLFRDVIKEVFNKKPKKLFSVFPTSTGHAITSILTGLTPAQHGMIHSYSQCIDNKKVILIKLKDKFGNYFDIEKFIYFKTFFVDLKEKEINSFSYLNEYFVSKYKIFKVWFKDTRILYYFDLIDGFLLLIGNLSNPGLSFFYTDVLDAYMHVYWMKGIVNILKELLLKIRNIANSVGGKVIVFGDHGLTFSKDVVEIEIKGDFYGGKREIGIFEEPAYFPEGIKVFKGRELEKLLGGKSKFAEPIYLVSTSNKGICVKNKKVPNTIMDHGGLTKEERFVAYIEI